MLFRIAMAEDDNDEIQRMTQYWSTLESKCGDIYQISCFADGDLLLEDFYEGKYDRNLLGGLYRENPVKSRNYEAVKSSKKWENVGNSYIIPALLLYRYSYI